MGKKDIQAIYDEDLSKLLTDLGLKEDFDNGRIQCAFCGDSVTMENFFGIFSDGKEIKFCCKKEDCKLKFSEENAKSS